MSFPINDQFSYTRHDQQSFVRKHSIASGIGGSWLAWGALSILTNEFSVVPIAASVAISYTHEVMIRLLPQLGCQYGRCKIDMIACGITFLTATAFIPLEIALFLTTTMQLAKAILIVCKDPWSLVDDRPLNPPLSFNSIHHTSSPSMHSNGSSNPIPYTPVPLTHPNPLSPDSILHSSMPLRRPNPPPLSPPRCLDFIGKPSPPRRLDFIGKPIEITDMEIKTEEIVLNAYKLFFCFRIDEMEKLVQNFMVYHNKNTQRKSEFFDWIHYQYGYLGLQIGVDNFHRFHLAILKALCLFSPELGKDYLPQSYYLTSSLSREHVTNILQCFQSVIASSREDASLSVLGIQTPLEEVHVDQIAELPNLKILFIEVPSPQLPSLLTKLDGRLAKLVFVGNAVEKFMPDLKGSSLPTNIAYIFKGRPHVEIFPLMEFLESQEKASSSNQNSGKGPAKPWFCITKKSATT